MRRQLLRLLQYFAALNQALFYFAYSDLYFEIGRVLSPQFVHTDKDRLESGKFVGELNRPIEAFQFLQRIDVFGTHDCYRTPRAFRGEPPPRRDWLFRRTDRRASSGPKSVD